MTIPPVLEAWKRHQFCKESSWQPSSLSQARLRR